MNARKATISVFILAVLGLQILSQVFNTDSKLWPFSPYRMYSRASGPGSKFSLRELWVVSSDPAVPRRQVTNEELRLTYFVYSGFVTQAASGRPSQFSPEPDSAAKFLSEVIAEHLGPSYHKAQVWVRTFEIGEQGLVSRDVRPELRREWEIPLAKDEK